MVFKKEDIDWSDPTAKISDNFTVKECTFLPSWGVFHKPSDTEKDNILKLAEKMEIIREFLGGNSVNTHCWMRPKSVNCDVPRFHGKNYNLYEHGAPSSYHIYGMAIDFSVSRITCNEVRDHLRPKLEEYGIRMEDKPDAGWVHVDIGTVPPGGRRFFKP
jgi:hypothetical protein